MKKTSISIEPWLYDLLTLRAKNRGVSRSEVIRTLIKDSIIRTPEKRFEKIGYFNDSNGILRSFKQI